MLVQVFFVHYLIKNTDFDLLPDDFIYGYSQLFFVLPLLYPLINGLTKKNQSEQIKEESSDLEMN